VTIAASKTPRNPRGRTRLVDLNEVEPAPNFAKPSY